MNPISTEAAESARLEPRVGLLGVVMFGAGTAIGVSILSVLGPAAKVAGSGLLVAMVLAALPMLPFALVYAYLSSALPKSGASYEWPARFVHPLFGFMIAWLRILGSVGVIVTLATVLVNYLRMVWPVPELATKAVVITALFGINLLGIRVAAQAQTVMMVFLLAAMGLFCVTGVGKVDLAQLGDPLAAGWPAVLAAVPLMITLFLGIESATEIGEEVRDARKTIPRGIALAVALTACVYACVATVALGLIGPAALGASAAPLLEAARGPLGQLAEPLIVGAAVFAVLKTLNALVMIFSRYLFAMGRGGVLPAPLGRLHPVKNSPTVALAVAWLASMAGLLLPSNLVFLLLAVNIPTMLKYLGSCLAAIRLVKHHPELHRSAQLGLSATSVRIAGWIGIVAAAAIIVAGLKADARPYLLVVGWGVVGLGYWFARRRSR
ncbi:APC family permease [Pelomonas sp. KK5]|uniref:APC family permease n=1 Tax=Pelomonas sp. KK5 TaxID=1855730 RepID=UPI00097CAD9C|nr:APC family permease [Pelomonas sp. KK5]